MANLIFISYRRSDIPIEQVNLIHEGLENVFGEGSVFLDTADIHGGAKWKKILNDAGTNAKVCLVLIGPRWMEKDAQGRIRIQQEGDWVRQEIEYAIEKKLVILPVLVNGGVLPKKEDLPESLQSFNDSQGIVVRTEEWSTYKEKLIRDLKKNIDGSSKLKRLVWILLPVFLVAFYLIYRNGMDKGTPEGGSMESETTCPTFVPNKQLKTLIFPIESQSAEDLERNIDVVFTAKCRKYNVDNDNKFATYYRGKDISSTDKPIIAQHCLADLYFSGTLSRLADQNSFSAEFGLSNDSLRVLEASPKDFTLDLTNISLQDLTKGKAIDSLYENVIQYILGLFAYQNGEYDKAVRIFKDLGPDRLQNDSMKMVTYGLMADACYQTGKSDSAIWYLNKLSSVALISAPELLKAGLLAEQNNKPDVAIASYSKLIDSGRYDKNILLEKRADQYAEIKEYSKAKQDYQRVRTTEKSKERVNTKIEKTNTQIERNRAAVTGVNNLHATETEKIRAADLYLQNGQANKAGELLRSIPKTSEFFKQAEPLLQEAQLKINPASVTVTEAAASANPRLKTEAGLKNQVIRKIN